MVDPATIERWKASHQDELDAAAIYLALAAAQPDAARKALLERMAADEQRHASHWGSRLREAGVDPGQPRPGQRARILCRLAGDFGDTVVLPIMRDRELQATESYVDESGSFAQDEAGHARALATLVGETRGEPIGAAPGAPPARESGRRQRAPRRGARRERRARLEPQPRDGRRRRGRRASRPSSSPASPGCSRAPARWRWANGSRCRARASSTRMSSRSSGIEIATMPELETEELALDLPSQGRARPRGARRSRSGSCATRTTALDTHGARGARDRPRRARRLAVGGGGARRSSSSCSARSCRCCRSPSSRATRPSRSALAVSAPAGCSRIGAAITLLPGGACCSRACGSSPSARPRRRDLRDRRAVRHGVG